jgi:hypothetical protein
VAREHTLELFLFPSPQGDSRDTGLMVYRTYLYLSIVSEPHQTRQMTGITLPCRCKVSIIDLSLIREGMSLVEVAPSVSIGIFHDFDMRTNLGLVH